MMREGKVGAGAGVKWEGMEEGRNMDGKEEQRQERRGLAGCTNMEKIGQRSSTGSGQRSSTRSGDATPAQTTQAIADTQSPGFKGDIPLEGESQEGGTSLSLGQHGFSEQ